MIRLSLSPLYFKDRFLKTDRLMLSSKQLGKVVKSNSHCDYVVRWDDRMAVTDPPQPEDYGFGSFVKLEEPGGRHWAVGLIYDSQQMNPSFMSVAPRLSSDPDPLFTPDLLQETRTLLGVVLIGTLVPEPKPHGIQGIPSIVIPVHTPVATLTQAELLQFHLNLLGRPQFGYYSHLLRFGGPFSAQLTQRVLQQLLDNQFFTGPDQRALAILCKELSWKNTVSAIG